NPSVSIPNGFSGMLTYQIDVMSADSLCMDVKVINITVEDIIMGETVDATIFEGETFEYNGVVYDMGGVFTTVETNANGCDILNTLNLNIAESIMHFDMNACRATTRDSANASYMEFEPEVSVPSCIAAESSVLYRMNPSTNLHSCTPGMNDTRAICISSVGTCDFLDNSDLAARIELNLNATGDEKVSLSGIEFYEKAPEMFEWIGGDEGMNNYPTLYGIRVLKNGTEIFKSVDQQTTTDWSKEFYDFTDADGFEVEGSTQFTIELLGYCVVGNASEVTAWDLEDIKIFTSCDVTDNRLRSIAGSIMTKRNEPFNQVFVEMMNAESSVTHTWTNEDGTFSFANNEMNTNYVLNAKREHDVLNGISSYDLLMIQRHIANVEAFSSPLDFIAADINNDKTITAKDISELRRVILGLFKHFPDNKSWKFISNTASLDIQNPWEYKEEFQVTDIEADVSGLNFRAIKIGDLNASAIHGDKLQNPRASVLNLIYDNQVVSKGDAVQIAVYGDEFES
ncbi:MAG: dockerin type I domain-containing protein, partial [Bacteroidota bacterium]